MGNAESLQEVFIIFVLNAKDAATQKENLLIRTESLRNASQIRILFFDPSSRMSQEDLARIRRLDPFADADTLRDRYNIRLSVVSEIIHAHKGTMSIESTVRKGAAFSIVLPVVSAQEKKS